MKAARGFTLAEVMVALAITLIVIGIGAPGMASLMRRIQLRTTASDLYGAVQFTRAQAIERNTRVLLAPRTSGDDWSGGWVVFVDADGDRRPGPGDDVLLARGPLPPGTTTHVKFSGPASPSYIAYNGAGRSCSASSSMAARWGSVTLEGAGQARRITINMLGRARMCEPGHDSACGPELPDT